MPKYFSQRISTLVKIIWRRGQAAVAVMVMTALAAIFHDILWDDKVQVWRQQSLETGTTAKKWIQGEKKPVWK